MTTSGQPGPNTPPAVDHGFAATRAYLLGSGICPHPQDSDPERRDLPKETRCLGGKWDSVALMVTGRDRLGNDLDKVRLLWRNWKPGAHLSNDKDAAAQFVAVLAERYISPKNRVEFAGDFMKGDSGRFRSGDFEVSLNAKDQGRYVLHRIELKNLTKRGTSEAPSWVPPSPPQGDYVAPLPVVQAQPQQPVWVNPNPVVSQPAPAPEPMPVPVPQPVEEKVVVPAPAPVPVAPRDEEIVLPPQPQPEIMAVPAQPVVQPAPVITQPAVPAPVVDVPVQPQPVAPIQPPVVRQPVSPAELIPNFPMDEEENYIFKEFDGEVSNDL